MGNVFSLSITFFKIIVSCRIDYHLFGNGAKSNQQRGKLIILETRAMVSF